MLAEVSLQNQESTQNAECSTPWLTWEFFWGSWRSRPGTPRPRWPAGAHPTRDYPTTPGKDVWNCDGHENKMTKFARLCVEECVSCWHAHRSVSRYVCVCVCVSECPVSGRANCEASVSQWVFSHSELWSRLIAGALSGKHDQLNTLQLYALID